MAKVVISYSRENDRIARNVARDIEAIGHAVWFDKALSGGQVWWDQILATIRDCDVFALILSPESLNSAACRREYSYAADLGKPILPVMVSEGVSINLLPPALSKLQYIDYLKQDRDAALGLARALTSVPPPPHYPIRCPRPRRLQSLISEISPSRSRLQGP